MKKKMTPYILLVPQLSFYYWFGNWNHPKFRGDSSFWINGTDAEIL